MDKNQYLQIAVAVLLALQGSSFNVTVLVLQESLSRLSNKPSNAMMHSVKRL